MSRGVDVIDLSTPPPQPDDLWQPTGDSLDEASTALLGAPLLELELEPEGGHDGASHTVAEPGLGQSGIFSSVVNLANTVVGAGMLGLPHAFAECGYVMGTLLLIVSAIGSSIGLHLLAVSQATVGIRPSSFYTVANAAMPSLTVLIDVAVALKCFGVATSYLIVVGDLMPDAVAEYGGNTNRSLWVGIGWLLMVPLACLRTLDALKFTSTLALMFVGFVTLFVLLYAVGIPTLDPCDGERGEINGTTSCRGAADYATTTGDRTLRVFSIFVFSFTCQQNVFQLCSELKHATIDRIDKVIGVSIGSSWCVYVVVAVSGFITYGDLVKPDILVNYPRSAFVSIVRVAVCLLVVFSYPLQSHPARRCILTMYIALRHGKGSRIAPTTVEFYAVTALFLTASFITAMSVTNLGSVLELVGATGSTAVSYILPGAIYWRLHPNAHPLRYIAAIQLAVGCCIVPIALTFIFL